VTHSRESDACRLVLVVHCRHQSTLSRAVLCCVALQLLDLTIDRDRPRFHVKIADFGLARMVGPNSSIAVSKVRLWLLVGRFVTQKSCYQRLTWHSRPHAAVC
jgi:hypothetical protein